MKTVPLHGKKAAGRVALVDDEDYELVMQYRWNVHEPEPRPGRRPKCPYAVTNCYAGGRHATIRMHVLIMGAKGIDHIDHDGLNNQRRNLRLATGSQNNQNARPRLEASSQYKGVCKVGRGLWRAYIDIEGQRRKLPDFASELEAAYAYDTAARELFGEFACPNFPEGPTRIMQEQWEAERTQRSDAVMEAARKSQTDAITQWWYGREPETFTCVECGSEFQSRAVGKKMYCGDTCRRGVLARWKRERRRENRQRREEAEKGQVPQ